MDLLRPAILGEYRRYKAMAERSFEQLTDEQLVAKLSPLQNSVFVIAQHLAGNLRSRFTDFLTTDGEKPDRDREGEFAEPAGPVPRDAFLAMWESGWRVLFDTLAGLTDADLGRTVTIRGERLSVADALVRSVSHAAYHAGQVALLAKHFKGDGWRYLTIPPGQSTAYTAQVQAGEASQQFRK
ncbi:MAG TPA: DUF1572 family protein [Humisphaera sp.]